MTDSWRLQNAAWLALRLRLLRERLERRGPAGSEPTRVAGQTEELGARLDELEAAMSAQVGPPALRVLTSLAGLSADEEEILLLAAAPMLDGSFAGLCAEANGDPRLDHPTPQLAFELLTGTPGPILAADLLMPHSVLRLLRLAELSEDDQPLPLRRLGVDDRMADYLRGVNRPDSRLAPFLEPLPDPAHGQPIAASCAELAALLDEGSATWPTVNVVGPVDAGAAEVVACACAAHGLHLWRLDLERFALQDPVERAELMALLGREAVLAGLAVIAQTEAVPQARDLTKVVDELVRQLPAPVFVTSTERWPVPAHPMSVVHLARPDLHGQRKLWRSALESHQHTVNGEIDSLVQQFDFGPAAIREVVARAAQRGGEPITGRLLWDACRDQQVRNLDEVAQRITSGFGWDDIVVPDKVRTQLRELADQVALRAQVYDVWGFGALLSRGRGITALFAGPSGTGKTMAAEILAAHLRLDLHRIDLAAVVSKYVGETEKNLRRVFDAAEHTGTILLFDEADALFGNRTDVRDSHDHYANLEINYLLQRMEDYTGLAILATNRRSALDNAFLRRLRFVVEFEFPGPEDRRSIWERVFPQAARLDQIDVGALSRLEISGANIRAIAVNAAFLAAHDGSPIGMPHLMHSAVREYAKLSKPVRSEEFGEWVAVVQP